MFNFTEMSMIILFFFYSKMCYLNIYDLSAPRGTFLSCDTKLKAEQPKDPSTLVSPDWKPGQKQMNGTAEFLNENRLISGPEHPGKRRTRHHLVGVVFHQVAGRVSGNGKLSWTFSSISGFLHNYWTFLPLKHTLINTFLLCDITP